MEHQFRGTIVSPVRTGRLPPHGRRRYSDKLTGIKEPDLRHASRAFLFLSAILDVQNYNVGNSFLCQLIVPVFLPTFGVLMYTQQVLYSVVRRLITLLSCACFFTVAI